MKIEDHMGGIQYQYRHTHHAVRSFQGIHLAIQGIDNNNNLVIQEHQFGQTERQD